MHFSRRIISTEIQRESISRLKRWYFSQEKAVNKLEQLHSNEILYECSYWIFALHNVSFDNPILLPFLMCKFFFKLLSMLSLQCLFYNQKSVKLLHRICTHTHTHPCVRMCNYSNVPGKFPTDYPLQHIL